MKYFKLLSVLYVLFLFGCEDSSNSDNNSSGGGSDEKGNNKPYVEKLSTDNSPPELKDLPPINVASDGSKTYKLEIDDADKHDKMRIDIVEYPKKGTLSVDYHGRQVTYHARHHDKIEEDFATIRVFDGQDYSEDATIKIIIYPKPTVKIFDCKDINTSMKVRLSTKVLQNNGSVAYSWTLDGVDVDGDENLTHLAEAGRHIISLNIKDEKGLSARDTCSFKVSTVPKGDDFTEMTDEDKPITIRLRGSDNDNDQLDFTIKYPPTDGNLTEIDDKTYSYRPFKDFNGEDNFSYTVSDVDGNTKDIKVFITVNPVNDKPLKVEFLNDDEIIKAGSSVILKGRVTDVDRNNTAMKYIWINADTQEPIGSVFAKDKNWLEFNTNQTTETRIYLIVEDGDFTVESNKTVTISTKTMPSIQEPVTLETNEDEPKNLQLKGIDLDGDTLTYEIIEQPKHGTIKPIPHDPYTNYTYTPYLNFHGNDSFRYIVKDVDGNIDTAVGKIKVHKVNDLPEVSAGDDIITYAGERITLRADVKDVDEFDYEPLKYEWRDKDGELLGDHKVIHPQITESQTITLSVTDGNHTVIDYVAVTLKHAPTASDKMDIRTIEDKAVFITLDAGDEDGDSLDYKIIEQPINGNIKKITSNSIEKFEYIPNKDFYGADYFRYIVTDSDGKIATAYGKIEVAAVNDKPTKIDAGIDRIIYEGDRITLNAKVDDMDTSKHTLKYKWENEFGNLLGEKQSITFTPESSQVVMLTVIDGMFTKTDSLMITIKALPVAPEVTKITQEDTKLVINLLPEGEFLDGNSTFEILTQPDNGSITRYSANGDTQNYTNSNFFIYTPNKDFHGTEVFHYVLKDSLGGVVQSSGKIFVEAVNDKPLSINGGDDKTVYKDTPFVLEAKVVDVDTNSKDRNYTYTWKDLEGNTYRGQTITARANKSTKITLTVIDGSFTLTDTVMINVQTKLTAKKSTYKTEEDTPKDIELDETDEDGDTLTYTLVNQPSNGTLSDVDIHGKTTYTPNENFNGKDTFDYLAKDSDGNEAMVYVEMTVKAINDALTNVSLGEDKNIAKGAPFTLKAMTEDVDTNDEHKDYTYLWKDSNGITYENKSKTITINAKTTEITVTVTDGDYELSDAIMINVIEVEHIVKNYLVKEDSVAFIRLEKNDTDGEKLTYVIQNKPTNGTVTTIDKDAYIIYKPNLDFFGQDTFDFLAADINDNEAMVYVEVNVTAINDAPKNVKILNTDTEVKEGELITLQAQAQDVDKEDIDKWKYAWYKRAKNTSSADDEYLGEGKSYLYEPTESAIITLVVTDEDYKDTSAENSITITLKEEEQQ